MIKKKKIYLASPISKYVRKGMDKEYFYINRASGSNSNSCIYAASGSGVCKRKGSSDFLCIHDETDRNGI